MIKIGSTEAFKKLVKSNPLVFVDFYADWCGPCASISPTLDFMAKQNQNVKFLKVNVDECEDLAIEYKVASIPYFVAFTNGSPSGKLVGADPEKINKLVAELEQSLKN